MRLPRARLLPWLVALAALGACDAQSAAPAHPPLVLERSIALKDVRGRIDHLAIDLVHRRIYVAELGNGSVEAIDLDRGMSRGRITGLEEPQGLAYLPALDELAVATGGDGTLRFYRAGDLSLLTSLKLGDDADNLRVDDQGRVVVGYGSGALAVVDPKSHAVVTRLSLPAHPEGFRIDGAKVAVNLPVARKIAVGDLARGKLLATWPGSHLLNFPMTLDATSGTIAIVYRLPARVELRELQSGAVKWDEPACGDADDVFFDTARHRLYVICGAGVVQTLDLAEPHPSSDTKTRPGARTGLFAPELDRLFVAARAQGGDAALLVYKPASER